MKITIIGGSGFVGSHLITLLRETPNIELLNIDKQPSRQYPEITQIANVLDTESLTRLLAGTDLVVLLAAEHKDDISPRLLYYDVNVGGMKSTLKAMSGNNITRIIFTSSVAIYGLNKKSPDETFPADPFNDYGKSKWEAECILKKWYDTHPEWNVHILRPTVIFGENNRGNVYNLLCQIASGKFLMIGNGRNCKSMAYIGNIVACISHLINQKSEGYNVFNYADSPDFTMNELVYHVGNIINKRTPTIHFPYWLGMVGGGCFDILSKITGKKFAISAVRIKKFCAVTQFNATKVLKTGFQPAYTLEEGLRRTLQHNFHTPNQQL